MLTGNSPLLKATKLVILPLGLLIFCSYVLYLANFFVAVKQYLYRKTPEYSELTTPLSSDVVQDLCMKLVLSPEDPRCQPGATVYAPEFFQTIKDALKPDDAEWAGYDKVEEVLGDYQTDCELPTKESDGKEYFTCRYDLRGDRMYPITVFFYTNGQLFGLSANTGRDPFL